MKHTMMNHVKGFFIVIWVLWLSSCGTSTATRAAGGGDTGTDSGTIVGLEIANQMSLVDAQTSTSSSSLSQGLLALVKNALTTDTSTAYYTDPKDVWVFDESMESLSIINEILCDFDQTQYAAMVNQGTYIALVDEEKCMKDKDQSDSQNNQSTSADADTLQAWVLDSSRATNDDPQIVKAWIDDEGDDFMPAMIIHAKMTITDGVSDTKPFGAFRMDFKMVDAETQNTTYAQGYLETVDRTDDQVEFQFSMTGDDSFFPVTEVAHVVTSVDGASGYAYTSHSFSFGEFSEAASFQVAFDDNHYLSNNNEGGTQECLDRNNFDNHVFRYGLYNEDGSRVAVTNPGFGIRYQDYFGWASYWGIWFDDAVELVSGLTVERANNDESSSSGATYTTVVGPGKLIKHTRSEITLGDISGAPMHYWDDQSGRNSRATWNGTNIVLDAVEACQPDAPCSWQEITPTNLAAAPGEWLSFWRDGLGSVFFEYPETALSDSTVVTFDKTQIMTGQESELANGAVALYCYQDCLRPQITDDQINWQNGESPFFDDSNDLLMPYVYSFNGDTMTVTYLDNPVKVRDGVTAYGQNQWGVQSGPMLTSVTGLQDTWDVWGQSVHYTWETGPNDWNRYMGLLDSNGNAVAFDPPMRLNYSHTDGILYGLEYAGVGELHGIPWNQVEGTDRWYPQFSITDGSKATGESGKEYYIRALEMEQRMQEDDASECAGLSLQSLDVPAATYTDPEVGSKPTVTDDPKVIKGELTGS